MSRHAVMRAGSRCHYCGRELNLTIGKTWDHIVPRSKGGTNFSYNRVPCCTDCNQLKLDNMPDCPCTKCEQARTLCWLENLPSLGIADLSKIPVWTKKYDSALNRIKHLTDS